MQVWLRLGGYCATEIAPHSPVTWETWADGGSGSATWQFDLTPRAQHPGLQAGQTVEVMCGAMPVFSGIMSEPNRTTWECAAYGLAADAQNYLALDSLGSVTNDVSEAVAQAIDRGWLAANHNGVGGTVAGDMATDPQKLNTLLDARAAELTSRWGVGPDRVLYMRADPTTPSWVASPDSTAFGVTNEGRVATLYGRYLSSATSTNQTTFWTTGEAGAEDSISLVDRGPMSKTDAEIILAGILYRDLAPTAWTNGVTLTSSQLQTWAGTHAFLPAVSAGQMVRAHGIAYAGRINTPWVDVVIGKTRYTSGEDSIYVEPVNTAARSFRDVTAANSRRSGPRGIAVSRS